ncbi:MAG TPA: YfiR family protein [Hydrogenophaga sp.]
MRRSRARRSTTGLLALLCCALLAGKVAAQQVSEQAVKAGFVYNFIKFTQWPPQPESDSHRLQICATSDKPLEGHIARLSGRNVGARTIEFRNNVGVNGWAGCDVLFIAQSEEHQIDAYLHSLGNAPVLSVGEAAGFIKSGGMIGLRMQDSRVKFDVNLGSAQRAGLQLNSQMLKLAGEVLK